MKKAARKHLFPPHGRLGVILGALGAAFVLTTCTIGDLPMRAVVEGLGLYWTKLNSVAGDSASATVEYGLNVSVYSGWAAVGCPGEGSTGQGAVYLYSSSSGTWTFSTKIAGTVANGYFGRSVALTDGYLIVGAPGENSDQGAAYVYAAAGSGWSSSPKRLEAPGGASGDFFGYSAAITTAWAVVGAPYHDVTSGSSEGSAYVYGRDVGGTGNWGSPTSGQWLHGELPMAVGEGFGTSVGISGSYIVVGSPQGNGGPASLGGFVNVFLLSSGTWGSAGSPTSRWTQSGEKALGISVSISGDVIVTGASGTNAAFAYRRSGTDWSGTRLSDPKGISTDYFGCTVAVDGTHIIVGSKSSGVDAVNGGRAFPFEFDGSTWQPEASFGAGPSSANQAFGSAISLNGDTALIAGYGNDTIVGSATFFHRSR